MTNFIMSLFSLFNVVDEIINKKTSLSLNLNISLEKMNDYLITSRTFDFCFRSKHLNSFTEINTFLNESEKDS